MGSHRLPPDDLATPSALYPPLRPGQAPLRIAVLLAAGIHGAELEPVLQNIAACSSVSIVLLIRYRLGKAGRGGSAAFALYRMLDRCLTRRQRQSGDTVFDPRAHCPKARILDCDGITLDFGTGLPADAAEEIRAADLDAILALDRSDWRGALLAAARHGVWSFAWNGQGSERLDAALAMALREGDPLICCALEESLAGASPTRMPAVKVEIHTSPRSLSITRAKAYDAAAILVPRMLRRLHRGEHASPAGPGVTRAPADEPGNLQSLALTVRLGLRWLHHRLAIRREGWWFLAMRRCDAATGALAAFRALPAERGHYYADPFLIEKEGKTHLFFEDFDQQTRRGRISHAALDSDGMPSPAAAVLERPYHLSYPFVFAWRGDIWMLPETGENRSVELYRCESFPQGWQLYRTLLQGWRMSDPTLHEDENGRWWLFVLAHEHQRAPGSLFVFMADTPLGPWRPHPGNPVQCDIRYARPGGRLFRRDGRLLRPGQDCSRRYGGALWLMEVVELTAERYREAPYRRLDPLDLPGNLCLHHRDATERFEFVDGMRLWPAEEPA